MHMRVLSPPLPASPTLQHVSRGRGDRCYLVAEAANMQQSARREMQYSVYSVRCAVPPALHGDSKAVFNLLTQYLQCFHH